jgi:hypothetical protein
MAPVLKALALLVKGLLGLLKIEFGTLALPAFALAPRPFSPSICTQHQQPRTFAWEAAQLLPL